MSVFQSLIVLAESAAPAGGAAGAEQPNPLMSMLVTFVPLIIIFYLFFIRPESKRRKEKESLLGGMKPKDDVVTIGGLYGTIVEIEGDEVTLLVDKKNGVKLKFRRSAIDTVNPGKGDEKK